MLDVPLVQPESPEARARLAAHLRDRVEELAQYKSRTEIAKDCRLTTQGLRDHINNTGKTMLPRTRVNVSRGLGWTEDSIDLILAGEEPIEDDSSNPKGSQIDRLEAKVDELNAQVERLLEYHRARDNL